MLGGRCQAAPISFATSQVDLAKKLEATAKEKGVELLLPTDVVVAKEFKADAEHKVVAADQIPEGWMVSVSFGAQHPGALSSLFECRAKHCWDLKPCTAGLGFAAAGFRDSVGGPLTRGLDVVRIAAGPVHLGRRAQCKTALEPEHTIRSCQVLQRRVCCGAALQQLSVLRCGWFACCLHAILTAKGVSAPPCASPLTKYGMLLADRQVCCCLCRAWTLGQTP